MKALTFWGKETIKCESVPDPYIQESSDALVRVQFSAICGSDLHLYHEREKGLDHGTIMGHEFIGEVIETGRAVKSFKKGDRVISPFSTNCGSCFYCKKELTSRCVKGAPYGWVHQGKGLQGTQAEYARVPLADSTLIHLPGDILPDEALLLSDILPTGYFCADQAEITPSGVYAVIGCGPVGLMAIISAKELGAQTIYAIDSIAARLAQAEKFGAIALNYTQVDPLAVIKGATEQRGADGILEVVGNTAAAKMAIHLLRPGGTLSVIGVHTDEHFAFSPVDAYDKNLTYKTGRCPARHYMERLIPLLQKKKYPLAEIISHHLPLEEGPRGYYIFDKKLEGCTKVALYSSNK